MLTNQEWCNPHINNNRCLNKKHTAGMKEDHYLTFQPMGEYADRKWTNHKDLFHETYLIRQNDYIEASGRMQKLPKLHAKGFDVIVSKVVFD